MKRIFVKSVNWVGDAVLVTPFLHILRRLEPQAHITLMARPAVAEVFEANPDIDRLWTANETASLKWFRRIARRIRDERFDIGISLPNAFGAALLLCLGGVKRRIGYDRDGRRLLLTDPVPVPPAMLRVHQVEYYIHLLRELGDPTPFARELIVPLAPGANEAILRTLRHHGLGEDMDKALPLVGMTPGAAFGTAKRWYPERYAQVADHLHEKWNARVLILGTRPERPVAEEIARHAKHPITILSGEIPLRGLIALCDHLAAFVCNDSGAMHIAAARDVPLVAVFGPTDWVTTSPFSHAATIVRKPFPCPKNPCLQRHCSGEHRCMRGVDVTDVVTRLDAMLEQRRDARAGAPS